MNYLIAAAGLIGTVMLVYSLLGARFMFPRWKRVALGLSGFLMAALMWFAHPNISGAEPDGSSLSDWW